MNEPYILQASKGSINLTDYTASRYEIYHSSYYYYQWHLRLDYHWLVRMDISFVPDINANVCYTLLQWVNYPILIPGIHLKIQNNKFE